MDFTFRDFITKDLLLSKYSEEMYMQYYLGIPVDKKRHINPLREDKHPTCGFYRSKTGTLLWHDFAQGTYLDFVAVVMHKYNVDYHQALTIIANDFHIHADNFAINFKQLTPVQKTFSNENDANIQVEIKEFTSEDLAWWNQFGITKKTLNKYNVFSCKTVFLNGKVHTIVDDKLVYGYYGGKDNGKELWRIYYPQKREFRFLTNWKGNKIQGWNQLPKSGSEIVITKSMKDVMVLSEFGIFACAPNSETIFLTDNQLISLKNRFKRVIVFFDNDLPGIASMNRLKKKHSDLIYTWLPRNSAKDISDYYKVFGKEKTYQIILEFIMQLNDEK